MIAILRSLAFRLSAAAVCSTLGGWLTGAHMVEGEESLCNLAVRGSNEKESAFRASYGTVGSAV